MALIISRVILVRWSAMVNQDTVNLKFRGLIFLRDFTDGANDTGKTFDIKISGCTGNQNPVGSHKRRR